MPAWLLAGVMWPAHLHGSSSLAAIRGCEKGRGASDAKNVGEMRMESALAARSPSGSILPGLSVNKTLDYSLAVSEAG